MTSLTTTQHGEHLEQPISPEVSVARGLLDREDLLQLLDRAVTKRVTVISAPPGSGKTSLLRAWADRSANLRRVAFVSVERDQQNAQRFWSAVLDALRSPARSIDPQTQPAATAALDDDEVVDRVLSELAERVEPVVLIIDDLHELRSADALAQLEQSARDAAELRARGAVVSPGSADQAAPAQARRRDRRDPSRRSAVHRARDARAAGQLRHQLVRRRGGSVAPSARKVGRPACAWR